MRSGNTSFVTPMALLAYHRVNFGAYTDSLGRSVGSASDDVLQLSGVADFAYPVPIDGTLVKTVTPRFSVRVNYFALRADTVNISPLRRWNRKRSPSTSAPASNSRCRAAAISTSPSVRPASAERCRATASGARSVFR